MVKEALTLKRFIETIDREIFPQKPAPINLWKHKYSKQRALAAYSHSNVIDQSKALLFVIKNILWYCFDASRYAYYKYLKAANSSTLRPYRRLMLLSLETLSCYVRSLRRSSYKVYYSKSLIGANDMTLCIIAWHEVRHRIQQLNIPESGDAQFNKGLESVFSDAMEIRSSWFAWMPCHSYKENQIAIEIDADFIAFLLWRYFRKEFDESASISEENLRLFMQDAKKVMTWKNTLLEPYGSR